MHLNIMKKEMIVLLLLGIIFVSPFILAQEQTKTYEGFDRFVDNVRMFFTFGQDGKVALSLEIREKEVNSAIANIEDEEESDKNLEKAWEKLQFIQEKVSLNTAEEVKESSNEIRNRIREEEKLSENFEVYVLEEEKTGLTAEWVIETKAMEVEQGNLEVAVNISEENKVMEIETRINNIDNEISNWVVENTYAEGTTAGGEAGVVVEGGLAKVVKTEVAQGDNGLKPEVKTYVASGGHEDNIVENEDEGGMAPGTSGTDAGDVQGYDSEPLPDVIEGGEGTPGKNEMGPAVESNEGDSESSGGGTESSSDDTESSSAEGGGDSVTGEAIKEIPNDNSLAKFFKSIFG